MCMYIYIHIHLVISFRVYLLHRGLRDGTDISCRAVFRARGALSPRRFPKSEVEHLRESGAITKPCIEARPFSFSRDPSAIDGKELIGAIAYQKIIQEMPGLRVHETPLGIKTK